VADQQRQELVGVFSSQERADAAARRVRDLGVPEELIHMNGHADKEAALRGEMRDELERSWFSPQAGFLLTKRAVKGMLVVSPVAIALGILIALPFAFLPWGPLPLWGRLLAVVLLGSAFGATVGFIVGGEAEKGAGAPLAAERGPALRVGDTRPEVREALVAEEPVRVDVVTAAGSPVGNVTNESETNDEGVFEDLRRAWDEPDRDAHNRHEDLSDR
jgi:hypothetical protein